MRTWLSTLPSEYFVSSRVAASSTASLIAIPRLPGEFGSASRTFLPDCVSALGLAPTFAPYVSISTRRYGFCWQDTLTMYTLHCRPKKLHAIATAEPNLLAPVSVGSRASFSFLLLYPRA